MIVSYFLRLTARYPAFGTIRFDFMLGCLILFFVLLAQPEIKGQQSVLISRRLKHFFFYILLSLPLVTWPGSVLRENLIEWIKVAFFFIFIVTLVRTQNQVKWIINIFMCCQTIRIIEPLYLHLTTGYWGSSAHSIVDGKLNTLLRLSGAPYDVVNPNQLAWVIVSMVPFLFYLLWKGNMWGKITALTLSPAFIYCLLLTGSRSGLLCLIFVLIIIVFLSKNKIRNLITASMIALPIAIVFFGTIGSDIQTRYLSLIDSSVAGAGTAQGRIDGLIRGIGSISNNPIFGNGLGTSKETNFNIVGGRAQITHDLYLEIFQETGLIGFILFVLFIIAILKGLVEAKRLLIAKKAGESDWLLRLVTAIQAWVVMHMFYSLSCFGLRSWEWYFFGGLAAISLKLAMEKIEPETFDQESLFKLSMKESRAWNHYQK